jgi:hypothetical protein
MANLGVVMREWKLGFESSWIQVLVCFFASWEREVQDWPLGGTYWRGSCVAVSWCCYECLGTSGFWFVVAAREESMNSYIAYHAVVQRFIGRLVEFCAACYADEEVWIVRR